MNFSNRTGLVLLLSNIASWIAILILWNSNTSFDMKPNIDELSVGRLNVVNDSGQVVMAISNKHRIPGPTFGGTEFPQAFGDGRDNLSGIIFFNEQGDEVGGLVYNGFPVDDRHWAGGHLSFDQWKHNQVVALQYLDNGNTKRAGLRVWDRPSDAYFKDFLDVGLDRMNEQDQSKRDSLRAVMNTMRDEGQLGIERMFVGSQDEVAQIQIRDTNGNVRVRLMVGPDDNPRLEFLDPAGNVEASYPK